MISSVFANWFSFVGTKKKNCRTIICDRGNANGDSLVEGLIRVVLCALVIA